MTAALTRSSYVETFQFSAGGQRTVRVSVMSASFPAADCSTLMDQRLKSFVDRSQLFLSVLCALTLTGWAKKSSKNPAIFER